MSYNTGSNNESPQTTGTIGMRAGYRLSDIEDDPEGYWRANENTRLLGELKRAAMKYLGDGSRAMRVEFTAPIELISGDERYREGWYMVAQSVHITVARADEAEIGEWVHEEAFLPCPISRDDFEADTEDTPYWKRIRKEN